MDKSSKNILISAYACEPNVGSEPGVGWNWVMDLSETYEEVHVVTRSEDRYVDADGVKKARPSKLNIEEEMKKLPTLNHIHFHYFDLPQWISNLERTIVGDILNVHIWEFFLFFFLKKRFNKNEFAVAQKVTIVSHRYPSSIWYFAKRYIHGPIAGGENFPLKLLPIFDSKNKLKEIVRRAFQYVPMFNPLVWLTLAKAETIIPVTYDTASILPKRFQPKCDVKQAISLSHESFTKGGQLSGMDASQNAPLALLFVGKLMAWKGIILVLNALKTLKSEIPVVLNVVGDGPEKSAFQQYVSEHELPVNILGKKKRTELPDYYASHDLFVFPSLRDSGGFVVLEAQANDLPCLVLDLGGPFVNHIPEKDIVIYTKNKTPEDLANDIARAIKEFYLHKKGRSSIANHDMDSMVNPL
ncbi:MAG: glycosyltransferase family 4 protein [Bacteroidota bacterium]